jgi:cytochrome c
MYGPAAFRKRERAWIAVGSRAVALNAVCKACHQVGDNAKNAVGPVLNGLFGRKAGSVEGYNYSEPNKKSGISWDEATFTEYIKDPKAKIPGTKMVFAGIKDEKKIKDLIAYLHTFDKAPVKLAQ